MLNLAETRAVTKVLYHDWFPQIHIDEHQMGSNGARLFVPPFMDPHSPASILCSGAALTFCGINMAYDLQKHGNKGVVHGRSYTGWWIGGLRRYFLAAQRGRTAERGSLGPDCHSHLHRTDRSAEGIL